MISNMPRYEQMKDSGVEWLGEIPVGWDILRMKSVILAAQNGFWGEEPKGNQNDIFCARVADFDRANLLVTNELSTIRNIPAEQRESRKVSKGDLLFEKSGGGDQTLVGALVQYVGNAPIICSNFVAVVRCKKGINPRWFCYINSYFYSVSVNLRAIKQTTGIQNIDSDAYFSELIPVPTTNEQTAIANFLDQKTAQIEQAIALKQKQIELFKERKQLVIQHAVTKGLNPHAPMRDSGVEWIGEIPEHWDVKRLKYGVSIQGGFAFQSTDFADSGIQLLKIANLYMNDLCLDRQPTFLNKSFLYSHKEWVVGSGDILMSLTGTLGKKDYGFAILLDGDSQFLLNQRVARLRISKWFQKGFLLNLLQSESYLNQLYSLPAGTKQANLSNEDVVNIKVPLPPLDEQTAIVAHIETQSAKIDKAIDIQQQQINKLKEYKATLINSAVTGKIKVV